MLTPGDLELRPTGAERNPWLREALAIDPGIPAPPLDGGLAADVAIVGGGYTGLWTAYQLLERDPKLRIVILEQDICGGGPSGRNGGFVNAWWDELAELVDLWGPAAALAAARAVAESVEAIGTWCADNGVDAHYRRAGMLLVSTSSLQDGAWRHAVEAAAHLDEATRYRELTPREVADRCASPVFRGGALMPDGATVQPALLARGLRRVCMERGVTIHEGTRVRAVRGRGLPSLRVLTGDGEVRARHVVLAVNAWGAGWPGIRGRVLTWSSYMVRTEPIPERLAELRWTGGESIVDARFSVHYLRTTRDGRIAFGAGGGAPGFGGRIGGSFTADLGAARRAAIGFRRFFPQLSDVRLTDAWGGPIDVSPDHLPHIGTLAGGRIRYAVGYSGNGVAPAHLLGKVLAALIVGTDEPLTRLPMVRTARRFPPEPFRYVGARVLREALIRREDGEELGHRPPIWLRELTRLPRRLGYRLGPR
ncbi:MAG: FAD-binding oxidoreductase [Chloroflexota bacterium]|nr:FAD-binding oxidoreductase [Chloroflexota bacterium]